MTGKLPTRRRIVSVTLLLVCGCLLVGEWPVAAQKRPRWFGGDKGVKYRAFKDPAARFEFEYPTKDWRPQPTGALVAVARNDGEATFEIDYQKLTDVIAPAEISTMAALEIETLKERHPQGKDFASEILDTTGGHGALIRYASQGTKGLETVIQYSLPIGLDLYRIIAIVPNMLLPKHEAVVMHMIESFKSVGGATPKG